MYDYGRKKAREKERDAAWVERKRSTKLPIRENGITILSGGAPKPTEFKPLNSRKSDKEIRLDKLRWNKMHRKNNKTNNKVKKSTNIKEGRSENIGVWYSYDDFTTKGHGVIEGYSYPRRKSGKRKTTSKKKHQPQEKNDLQSVYRHLDAIHRQAVAERKYQAIDQQKTNTSKNKGK